MKIVLTRSQAEAIIGALEMAINDDYPDYDPINASYIRLIKKFEKSLGIKSITYTAEEQRKIKKALEISNTEAVRVIEEINKSKVQG